jgi:uncharacterized membrane protein
MFMGLLWVVVIGLTIRGVVRMSKRGGYMHGESRGSNALDIAKARYAKGEIGAKEFETIKKTLY